MEAVVRMSSLQNARTFTMSCLPTVAQLNLHVDGRHFMMPATGA